MSLFRAVAMIVALLALAASSALAAPGDCRLIRGDLTPEDLTDDVSVCRQDVWFHQADSKAGNLGAAAPSWNTTKPTASVQSGAGAAYLSNAAGSQQFSRTDARDNPTFKGTFTGNIDNIAATMYLANPGRQAAADQAVWMQLKIDGEPVYETGSAADRTPLTDGGTQVPAVRKANFAFENIYAAMQELGLDTAPDKTHAVELSITGWFGVNDNSMYFYDTSEVPSGMVFNLEPSGLAAYKRFPIGGE